MFSMSKTYGMAGWRLGFVVGNAEIVARLDLLADHARVGIFAPVQQAGIAALTGPQDSVAERRRRPTERRRDRVARAAARAVASARASFYVWWELPEGLTPERLLAEHRVAVAPGEGFGSRGAGWARLSLAVTDEVLETGLERLAPGARLMLAIVFGFLAFLGFFVAAVWIWSRPGEPDKEETAGLIAGSWPRIKDRLHGNRD